LSFFRHSDFGIWHLFQVPLGKRDLLESPLMSVPPPTQGPGYFSDNPYQTPATDPSLTPRRGLVNQVRVIAILNVVQGFLELLMALGAIGYGIVFMTILRPELMRQEMGPGEPDPTEFVNFMTGFMFAMGAVLMLTGVLRIVAAVRNFFFLSRVLGIVAVCFGLVSSLTAYCAPTSIAVAVYSLIVLFNREVAEAFEMRASGKSADDVLAVFNSRPS